MSFDKSYYEEGNKGGMTTSFWEHPTQQEQLGFKWNDLVRCGPFDSILYVGCAKGYEPLYAQERGKNAYGIDISEWAVSNAEPKIKGKVRVFDGEKIHLEDNAFEVVASYDVISVAKNKQALVSEMARVSKMWIVVRTSIITPTLRPGVTHGIDGIPFSLETLDYWEGLFAMVQLRKFNMEHCVIECFKPEFHRATMWFKRV